MLPPTPECPQTPAPSPCHVVMALRGTDRNCLARAGALASDRRRVLHLVVHTPQLTAPWVLLAGGRARRGSPQPVNDLADRLHAAGVHVEVHRTTGRPTRLAQGIAATCGADLAT